MTRRRKLVDSNRVVFSKKQIVLGSFFDKSKYRENFITYHFSLHIASEMSCFKAILLIIIFVLSRKIAYFEVDQRGIYNY
jgi:hypothetical protein